MSTLKAEVVWLFLLCTYPLQKVRIQQVCTLKIIFGFCLSALFG